MRRVCAYIVLAAFLANTFGALPLWADELVLPKPGTMVYLSTAFNPPILKGIKVHPDNQFRFDFILDKGDSTADEGQLKEQSNKLIRYFLASLTVPEKDLWVNLSPYEKDRIVPEGFGQTEMGRDLLAEDYMLKQITASLIYPEGETGRKFWKRIYEEAAKKFGLTAMPVNTFNKVWIVPEKAVVYENIEAGTAYIVESRLKVLLEQDYLSLEKHKGMRAKQTPRANANPIGTDIIREIVIPELTREINEGKNFSQLRQVYSALILATWFKKKAKDSILEQVYANKNKVSGINVADPQENLRIYERYIQAFKQGAYNYIKEDIEPSTRRAVPRKYFSGGVDAKRIGDTLKADAAMTVNGLRAKRSVELSVQLTQVPGAGAEGLDEATPELTATDADRFLPLNSSAKRTGKPIHPTPQDGFRPPYSVERATGNGKQIHAVGSDRFEPSAQGRAGIHKGKIMAALLVAAAIAAVPDVLNVINPPEPIKQSQIAEGNIIPVTLEWQGDKPSLQLKGEEAAPAHAKNSVTPSEEGILPAGAEVAEAQESGNGTGKITVPEDGTFQFTRFNNDPIGFSSAISMTYKLIYGREVSQAEIEEKGWGEFGKTATASLNSLINHPFTTEYFKMDPQDRQVIDGFRVHVLSMSVSLMRDPVGPEKKFSYRREYDAWTGLHKKELARLESMKDGPDRDAAFDRLYENTPFGHLEKSKVISAVRKGWPVIIYIPMYTTRSREENYETLIVVGVDQNENLITINVKNKMISRQKGWSFGFVNAIALEPDRAGTAVAAKPGADRAMVFVPLEQRKGGIDLSPDKALFIRNSGQAIKFRLDSDQLKQLRNAPGFTAVNIAIHPVTDLGLWLGVKGSKPAI